MSLSALDGNYWEPQIMFSHFLSTADFLCAAGQMSQSPLISASYQEIVVFLFHLHLLHLDDAPL